MQRKVFNLMHFRYKNTVFQIYPLNVKIPQYLEIKTRICKFYMNVFSTVRRNYQPISERIFYKTKINSRQNIDFSITAKIYIRLLLTKEKLHSTTFKFFFYHRQ